MKNLEEKTVATSQLYKGSIISLQVEEVLLPNGKKAQREIVKHPGAVAIMAFTDEGKLILVEQYRKALNRTIIEIPAGKLEKKEEPAQCAKRELEEETGYGCSDLKWLISFYTSPGFADEIIHLYLATGLTKKENPAQPDEDEFVNTLEVTLEEAQYLLTEQKIYDAKTAYAVQYMLLQEAIKNE